MTDDNVAQPELLQEPQKAVHSKKTDGVHGNTGKHPRKMKRVNSVRRKRPLTQKEQDDLDAQVLEENKRIAVVKKMLATMMHKHEIKDVLRQLHGINWRQSETYITRAREELALEAGKSVDEHRVDSYAFYMMAMRDPSIPVMAKAYIRERIDRLFGLERHTIVHQGSKDNPVQVVNTVIDPLELIEQAKRVTREAEEKRAKQIAAITEQAPSQEGQEGGSGSSDVDGSQGSKPA